MTPDLEFLSRRHCLPLAETGALLVAHGRIVRWLDRLAFTTEQRNEATSQIQRLGRLEYFGHGGATVSFPSSRLGQVLEALEPDEDLPSKLWPDQRHRSSRS